MAITRVNTSSISASNNNASAYTVVIPQGLLAGDLVIVTANSNGTHVTEGISCVEQWNATTLTTITEVQQGNASVRWQQCFYMLTPFDIDPGFATIEVTPYASCTATTFVVDVFRGTLDGVGGSNFSGPTGLTANTPALATAPAAGDLVLSLTSVSSGTATQPSPYLMGSQRTTGPTTSNAYILAADGVSTYGGTWTWGTSNSSALSTVVFAADPNAAAPPDVVGKRRARNRHPGKTPGKRARFRIDVTQRLSFSAPAAPPVTVNLGQASETDTSSAAALVAYRQSTATGTADAQDAGKAISVPAGSAADDVAVLIVEAWLDTATDPVMTWPSGFTEKVFYEDTVTGFQRVFVGWKRLTAADSGTYAYTLSGSYWNMAHCITVSGCETSGDPFEDFDTVQNAVGTALPVASVDATTQPFLIHAIANENNATKTPPTSFTEVQDGNYLETAYRIPGSTGTFTTAGGSTSVSTLKLCVLLALKAASASAVTSAKTVSLGQAVETDTSFALTIPTDSVVVLGQATETDTASVVALTKTSILGQAAEVDTSSALTTTKGAKTLGESTETDTASAVVLTKSQTAGLASETDTSSAVVLARQVLLGLAQETDSSAALTATKAAKALSQAAEADTASAVALTKGAKTFGEPTEADTAQALSLARQVTLGEPQETDTSSPLQSSKVLTWGQVVEADTAASLTLSRLLAAGLASEADTAQALGGFRTILLSMATETSSAPPLTSTRTVSLGQASESDSSFPLSSALVFPLGQAHETDDSAPLTINFAGGFTLGFGDETSVGLPLLSAKVVTLGLATETGIAQTVTGSKALTLSSATETDTALALAEGGGRVIELGFPVETDSAFVTTILRTASLGLASETDSAHALSLGVGAGRDIEVSASVEGNRFNSAVEDSEEALGIEAGQFEVTLTGLDNRFSVEVEPNHLALS